MEKINREPRFSPHYLATDLDGTLIPLPDHPENREALERLRDARKTGAFGLLFCTGRHFESVEEAREIHHLPDPDWIICDVGTSIFHRESNRFHPHSPYRDHLSERVSGHHRDDVETLLKPVERLALQCDAHQGTFKISYECETPDLDPLLDRVKALLADRDLPYEVHGSIDPFAHCGLIDVLPRGVSKDYALRWLANTIGIDPDRMVYAGDSGNDLPALAGGFRAILVANASEGLADTLRERIPKSEQPHRLYLAEATATSGVLEGCRHYGLIPA